jgi:ABC-2 type transport system ATP-binding protein
LIVVNHLTKEYDGVRALDDISFHIEKGRIYGLLGKNGAGKSTTMNLITGCIAPTDGTVSICGHDILLESTQAKKCIGYLPELPPLYGDLTPREYLSFVCEAKGVAKKERARAVDRLLSQTKLSEVQDRLISHLSKGYRQRVGIAQAMAADVPIVILDEPTVGLDPAQVIETRELIRSLGKTRTVLISSHILSEINALCNHVIILSDGKIVADDSVAHLKQYLCAEHALTLRVKGAKCKIETALQSVGSLENITFLGENEGVCTFRVRAQEMDDTLLSKVSQALVGASLCILGMSPEESSLEDVFLALTARTQKN